MYHHLILKIQFQSHSRFKVRMCGLQVDNQLPLTPMPVLFRPQRGVSETDYILKCSITMQSNGSLDLCVYPYIGLHVSITMLYLVFRRKKLLMFN